MVKIQNIYIPPLDVSKLRIDVRAFRKHAELAEAEVAAAESQHS